VCSNCSVTVSQSARACKAHCKQTHHGAITGNTWADLANPHTLPTTLNAPGVYGWGWIGGPHPNCIQQHRHIPHCQSQYHNHHSSPPPHSSPPHTPALLPAPPPLPTRVPVHRTVTLHLSPHTQTSLIVRQVQTAVLNLSAASFPYKVPLTAAGSQSAQHPLCHPHWGQL